MNPRLLLLPLLALAFPAAAQQTELIGRAGLGLFQFAGNHAESISAINYTDTGSTPFGYTNNPYGGRFGTGFALGGRVQHVSKRSVLVAFDLGYEWLRSRTEIDHLNYFDGRSNTPRPADGSTHLQTQNLTAFLGLGHRFSLPVVKLDVLAGPEAAYVFGFHEKGSGTYDGSRLWTTDQNQRAINRGDARLRADITAWYQRIGFNASYSHGFLNYQGGYLGGSPEAFSRTLRLGLAYQLK